MKTTTEYTNPAILENGTPIVAHEPEESKSAFDERKRAFERAYLSGGDYGNELMSLSLAIAGSVLKKLCDPQRKTAQTREGNGTSNSGQNPTMIAMRRELYRDYKAVLNLAEAVDAAYALVWDSKGNAKTEVVDRVAADVADALASETLGDGLELLNEAAAAILEQAEVHASGEDWLDTPYGVRRLSKRVYIKLEDSAQYREEMTTPIQEVYRAVRRAVQNSRAVQTDPRNGYSYIEDYATEDVNGADAIYFRLGKYADLGGASCYGLYTVDRQSVMDYNEALERLNLTERQARVVDLRMRGYGNTAIASYLGVTERAVYRTLERIQKHCNDIGFTPVW